MNCWRRKRLNILAKKALNAIESPEAAAASAALRYVSDAKPGICRVRHGKRFLYHDAYGRKLADAETMLRIKSLAIPPAWEGVWICPIANGHLQATGRDARGRKQYRYHKRWRETRDENKYDRMLEFGRRLPELRRRVARDLSRAGLPRRKVLATVVSLLESTLIRIGNEEYARHNKSFGLTTMRDRHVKPAAKGLRFEFEGKSRIPHAITVTDSRLAKIVKRCRDLPGYTLFQYFDRKGQQCAVEASDVNAYLREAMKQDFTAKDFRTWAGTVLAFEALTKSNGFETKAQAAKNVIAAVDSVAKKLGNTKSVCRNCYIHPEIIAGYLERDFATARAKNTEAQVMALLRRRSGNGLTPALARSLKSKKAGRRTPRPGKIAQAAR